MAVTNFSVDATNSTESSNETESTQPEVVPLTGHIDSVYLQWSSKTAFFYRDEYAYALPMNDPLQPKRWGDPQANILEPMGEWNRKWSYLCDVLEDLSYAAYCSVQQLKTKK